MKVLGRGLTRAIVAGLLTAATACGSTKETALGPSSSSAPQVSAISPQAPEPSTNPQLISVTGDRFAPGLTLLLTSPNQPATEVSPAAIQFSNSNSFQATVVLSVEGSYSLRVRNPSNVESNSFPFNVRRIVPGTPAVTGISPSATQRSPGPVLVTITGSDFAPGLTVTMFSPSGPPTTLTGGSISGVSATSVQLSVVLNQTGLFTFQIVNPDGAVSNTLSISVS